MRTFRGLIAASSLILSTATMAIGQAPVRRGPIGDLPPPPGPGAGRLRTIIEPPAPRPFDEAEAAGLPPGTKLQVLSLPAAYGASLGEKRANAGPVPDFARVRDALLSKETPASGFRDPTADYLDLLRKRVEVETAARRVAGLHRILGHLIEGLGPGSGITPLSVNQVDSTLLRARSERADRELAYRDALDALKVRLNIPPETPMIADPERAGRFLETFDALAKWWESDDLTRNTEALTSILGRLPRAAEVAIDGRSTTDVASKHPEALASLLASATRPDVKDGLAVRSRVRRLVRIAQAVETDRDELLRATARRDNALRLINAPPQGSNNDTTALVGASVEALIEADAACSAAQARLLRDWVEGHVLRIAIGRDLGSIPQGDWDAFLKPFSEPGDPPKTP